MHAGMVVMHAAGGEAYVGIVVMHAATVVTHAETAVSRLPVGATELRGGVLWIATGVGCVPAGVAHGSGEWTPDPTHVTPLPGWVVSLPTARSRSSTKWGGT